MKKEILETISYEVKRTLYSGEFMLSGDRDEEKFSFDKFVQAVMSKPACTDGSSLVEKMVRDYVKVMLTTEIHDVKSKILNAIQKEVDTPSGEVQTFLDDCARKPIVVDIENADVE